MRVMVLSIVGIAVQSEWGISPGEESLLTTMSFAGMLVGSYIWGIILDAFGRRKGFIGVAAGIWSAFSPNYLSFLVWHCLLGFGVGDGHVFTAWFLEFLPTHNIGAWAFALSSFWSFGTILKAHLYRFRKKSQVVKDELVRLGESTKFLLVFCVFALEMVILVFSHLF